MFEQLIVDVRGDAEPAALGKRLGVFVGQERPPDLERTAAAHRAVAVGAGEHLLEHRIQKHRLEFLRSGLRLALDDRGRVLRGLGRGKFFTWMERCCCDHHIISMSAWMAPAALMACRMVIMSRGPMPSALSPSTTCCSETPSLTTASFLPSSVTPTRVRATSRVRPFAKALG